MTDPGSAESQAGQGDSPPRTGDDVVDAALAQLHDAARSGDLDALAAAGEAAHRVLTGRLADPAADPASDSGSDRGGD